MNTQPLVTVYITNYNYEKYLEQSIQSVINQSTQDFELLIIDDGSTDNSRDIIEKYRDDTRITVIYQQNKGLNITNNIAMRVAKGKYLMRLDADDFLESNALEEMSMALEADDELGLVFPDYYYVDGDGMRTGEERRHDFNKDVSLYDQPAHGACTMIRLEFLKKLGGYNESFTCQDGYELWIKFIAHYKVSNINLPLFSYRRHGNNLTTNENRILSTRRAIKRDFIREKLNNADTLAVIPVRSTFISGQNLPIYKAGDSTLLENKVKACIRAEHITKVAIISAEEDILSFANDSFAGNNDVLILKRTEKMAGPNQSLNETVKVAIQYLEQQNKGQMPNYVLTASLEFPYVDSSVIDEMVHTQLLFESNSVLSVRPDNRMYYRHTGKTLQPILDMDKFTKLEREALYKSVGGLMLTSINQFKYSGRMLSGIVSHVVVDEREAFGIMSKFDFEVFERMANQENNRCSS